jgi:fructosamine-3-kinase
VVLTPLTGGVASDIFRVETATRIFAVKRALERLRVEAEWRVTTQRNTNEVGWLEIAGQLVPGAAPAILGHDPEAGLFAMEFLDPRTHPTWKSDLLAGRVDTGFAAEIGRRVAAIHAGTSGDPDVARRFDTIGIFRSIRLEPYLEATADRHPALAGILHGLSRAIGERRIALVHGDVSPKNILTGARGPVFLDAECAWYGDPAFDLAFCLNHLLLKCVVRDVAAPALLVAFDALSRTYLDAVDWEPADEIEARAAALLPGLLLGRIDGKSPVEYITEETAKDRVRGIAAPLIASAPRRLATVRTAWATEFCHRGAL